MTSRLSLNVLGLSVLHLAVALVFLKGFLLTRIELPHVSQCPPETCSSYRPYSKAVVLIVDALRYDFLCERASSDSYYRGKLPRTLDHVAKGVRRCAGSAQHVPCYAVQREGCAISSRVENRKLCALAFLLIQSCLLQ